MAFPKLDSRSKVVLVSLYISLKTVSPIDKSLQGFFRSHILSCYSSRKHQNLNHISAICKRVLFLQVGFREPRAMQVRGLGSLLAEGCSH